MKRSIIIIIVLLLSSGIGISSDLKRLDTGLIFYNFQGAFAGYNYEIYILKVDPNLYFLELLMSSKTRQKPLTLKEWSDKYKLIAVINASMFWKDQMTSTGYMRSKEYINQKLIHKKYGGFFVFDPKVKGLPYATIIERTNQDNLISSLKNYNNVIQNFRMISKNRENLWEERDKAYSVAAIGIDNKQNILLIFSKIPIPMYYLNEILLRLPININSCLFTEGGSTSGLYIRYNDFVFDTTGYSQMELFPTTNKQHKVPNVLGVKKR